MKNILCAGLCAALLGCASPNSGRDLTSTEIELVKGTNRARIRQPKDTKWDELHLTDDGLIVRGYVSAANAGALELEKVRAQSAHDALMQGILLGRDGAAAYLRSQGIPIQTTTPPAPAPAPNTGRVFDPTPGVSIENLSGRNALELKAVGK